MTLAFAIFAFLVAFAVLVYVVRTARRKAREATPQRRSSDGPLIHLGTQLTPAQAAAVGRAAASVAQAQEAMQRLGQAAAKAGPAVQQFSTAASRAQARQQHARPATVPAPRPKAAAPSPAPARQEDDAVNTLSGLAITGMILDDLASSTPDLSMPDPTPDPPSFDGGGGDFGGGGSTGDW